MKRPILTASLIAVSLCMAHLGWWVPRGDPPWIPSLRWEDDEGPFGHLLSRSAPDPGAAAMRAINLRAAEGFVFTMGFGGIASGLNVLRVDAAGHAVYIFSAKDGDWWRADFTVPASKVAALRALLAEVEYASLALGYTADVYDGTHWCLRVDVTGATKRVICHNHFPDAVRRIVALVGKEILEPHEADIKKARWVWSLAAERAAAVLWR